VAEPDRDKTGRGRPFEDFMKPQINPENPTPSGFSYFLPGPSRDGLVSFDDCQQKTGILFEYKGPGFSEHLQKQDPPWWGMYAKIMRQADLQVQARGTKTLIWFFAEKDVADYFRERFDQEYGDQILVEWAPYRKEQE